MARSGRGWDPKPPPAPSAGDRRERAGRRQRDASGTSSAAEVTRLRDAIQEITAARSKRDGQPVADEAPGSSRAGVPGSAGKAWEAGARRGSDLRDGQRGGESSWDGSEAGSHERDTPDTPGETRRGRGQRAGVAGRGAGTSSAGTSGERDGRGWRGAGGWNAVGEHGGADEHGAGADGERGRGRGRSGVRSQGRQQKPETRDPQEAAREICLRQLAVRPRTRSELAQALRKRGIEDDVAASVLDRYDEVGLIDDAAFAKAWVTSRHHGRGLASRALAQELRQRGVSKEDTDDALSELDSDTEARTALDLATRRLRSMHGQPDAIFRRLVGMLARKGYPAGVAVRAVKEALASRDAELAELIDPDAYEE